MSVKELQQERNQLFSDMFNNIIPKRMPVSFALNPRIIAEYAKLDIFEIQFNYGLLDAVADEASQLIYSDTCPIMPVGLASRIAGGYQAIDSQSFQMGSNGFMQHPEVIGMTEDEYPDLIADPYACILEKVLPRQHKALSLEDPVRRSLSISAVQAENNRQLGNTVPIMNRLIEKYGYYKGAPAGSGGFTAAPYDFLSDQLRSFSGISMDIRRKRSQIAEACEALMPLMFQLGLPSNPSPEGAVGMPLHMPTFMREKDFVEIWLPTYLKIVQQYAARGIRTQPFLEDDWMRYVDIIQELPAGTIMMFEYGDPKLVKEKLGDKFIIKGLYPLDLIKRGTKQQVIDKAKELLDIMLPGGGYIFSFDKGPLMLSDINLDNYRALSEFLRDYAVYDNAGESYGRKLNSENFAIDSAFGTFESKYLTSWDEYKTKYPMTPDSMKKHLENYDMASLRFYLNLLV